MAKRKPTEALDAVQAAGRAVDVGELAEELLSAFGGARKFAREYHTEFAGCKPGSISKSKMLDGVLRVVAQATAQHKGRDNTADLSDDELAGEIVRLLETRGLKATPDDGPPAQEGTAS